jgi:DNA-binding NarL/FixJ family response regulator
VRRLWSRQRAETKRFPDGWPIQHALYFSGGGKLMLSRSERKVVDLLLQGKANKEICNELGVTEKTIKFHITNILAKEEVGTRYELMAKLKNSFLDAESLQIMKDIILGSP